MQDLLWLDVFITFYIHKFTLQCIGTTHLPAPSYQLTQALAPHQSDKTYKYQNEVVVHIWWLQDQVYDWPWILTAVDVVAPGAVAGHSLWWPCRVILLMTVIVWPSWSYICCPCWEAWGCFSSQICCKILYEICYLAYRHFQRLECIYDPVSIMLLTVLLWPGSHSLTPSYIMTGQS